MISLDSSLPAMIFSEFGIPQCGTFQTPFPQVEESRSFPMVSISFRHSQRLSPSHVTAMARTARWISWSASVPAVCCAAATRKPSCGTWWRPRRGAPDGRTGLDLIWANHGKTIGRWWLNGISWDLPSGYVKIAIENCCHGHRNRGFSHEKHRWRYGWNNGPHEATEPP